MQKLNICIVLRKSKDKTGLFNVYIRITLDGKRCTREISTGIKVLKEHWDGTKITSKTNEALLQNRRLSLYKAKLEEIYLQAQLNRKKITANYIVDRFKAVKDDSPKITDYMLEVIELKKSECVTANTLRGYITRMRKFIRYLESVNKLSYKLIDVDKVFLSKYQSWLKGQKHKPNYIAKCMMFLNLVFKQAEMDNLIDRNPINYITIERPITREIIYLTEEELACIENLKVVTPGLQKTKKLFLFQCYTGMAFCDMLAFNPKKDIITVDGDKVIKMNRQKNNAPFTVPITKKAEKLVKSKVERISNQKYNMYLKHIADMAGIRKHLTSHVGRRTFGCIAVNSGMPLECVQVMLGHTDIKVTQTAYVKLNNESVVREMKKHYAI